MGIYVAQTTVAPEKTQMEIRQLLAKYKADQFILGEQTGQAVIGFRMKSRAVRFLLPLPLVTDNKYNSVRGHDPFAE